MGALDLESALRGDASTTSVCMAWDDTRGDVRHIGRVLSILVAVVVGGLILCRSGFADAGANAEAWQSSCQGLFKQDFSTYWLWVNYWTQGHNPYDTDQLRVYAHSLNCTVTGSHYVPPFIVPLLTPLMVWPLNVSAMLWAVLNCAMLVHIARVMLRDWHPHGRLGGPLGTALILFSPAAAACVAYGQFGILCAWGMVMASRSVQRAASVLPIVLVLAALKPHLGYLYWLGFVGNALRTRKVGMCVATVVIALLSTVVVESLTPGAVTAWVQRSGGALTWMGASPITYLRLAFQMPDAPPPLWPVLVGPLVALGYAVWHLKREGRSFDRERDLPLFSALSLCSTPYLWCLDFPVLLIAELSVLSRCSSFVSSQRSVVIAAGVVVVARIVLTAQMLVGVSDYRTGWYPVAILMSLLVCGSPRQSRT